MLPQKCWVSFTWRVFQLCSDLTATAAAVWHHALETCDCLTWLFSAEDSRPSSWKHICIELFWRLCVSFMCLLVTFSQFSSAEHLNLCQTSLELWANWHFKSNHKSWTPTWPTIVVFKPLLWSFDFLFRVIVLLGNKSSPKLQFFCRLQQEVCFFSPPVLLLWFCFLHLSALRGLLHSDVSSEKHSQRRVFWWLCSV